MECIRQRNAKLVQIYEHSGEIDFDPISIANKKLNEIWRHTLEKIYRETVATGILFQIKKSEETVAIPGVRDGADFFLFDLKGQRNDRIEEKLVRSLQEAGAKIGLRYPTNFGRNAGLVDKIEQLDLEELFVRNGVKLGTQVNWQSFPNNDTFQFTILGIENGLGSELPSYDLMVLRLALIEFSNEFLRSIHLGKLAEKQLTSKQIEILNLMGSELTDQEIADLLGISCSAVRRRFEAIQIKFSTSKRLGLIVKAVRSGIIMNTVLNEIY